MCYRNLDKFLVCIIGIYSLLIFLASGQVSATAYPDSDMGTFLERFVDPNFLPHDFYTNSTSSPNPRFIFGYFVGYLAKIFFTNWYKVFFFIKVSLILFNPIFAYLMIVSFFRNQSKNNQVFIKLIAGIMVIYLLRDPYKYSVAYWSPLYFYVSAQTISFLFGVVAIFLLNNHNSLNHLRKYSRISILGVIFFIASTFMHPTIGIIFFTFYVLFNYAINNQLKLKENSLYFLIIIVLPFLILYLSFVSKNPLPVEKFIEIYAFSKMHIMHYSPRNFSSLTSDSWLTVFMKINFVFYITLVIGIIKKDLKIIKIALLSMLIFCGSAILQYLGIELFKIKIIAVIGPSRAFILGYWMAVLCIIALFVRSSESLKKYKVIVNNATKLIFNKFYNMNIKKQSFLFAKTMAFFVFVNIIIFIIALDDPFVRFDEYSSGMFSWIKNNVEEDAIILTDNFEVDIPILAKRSTLSSGFPFNEDFFEEFHQREKIINEMKMLNKKQLQEFSKKFKFNYVIFYKGDKHQLIKEKPIYTNKYYLIYKI